MLPPSASDSLCLATTVYLEARGQSELGQQAVAEVALRREEDGRWGDSMCEVVTAPKQFAPTLVNPNYEMANLESWQQAFDVAFQAQQNWKLPADERREVVPGATHFAAHYVNPSWTRFPAVATIGDHTFYKVEKLHEKTVRT